MVVTLKLLVRQKIATNNEGNETQNEDDMDGMDVQADQESGPAQIESEWNDTVTAVPHALPFRGKELLVQPAESQILDKCGLLTYLNFL